MAMHTTERPIMNALFPAKRGALVLACTAAGKLPYL
jgi:hypothetical protein